MRSLVQVQVGPPKRTPGQRLTTQNCSTRSWTTRSESPWKVRPPLVSAPVETVGSLLVQTGTAEIRALEEQVPAAQGSGDGMEIIDMVVSGNTVTFNTRFFYGADGAFSDGEAGCGGRKDTQVTVEDGKITLYVVGLNPRPCAWNDPNSSVRYPHITAVVSRDRCNTLDEIDLDGGVLWNGCLLLNVRSCGIGGRLASRNGRSAAVLVGLHRLCGLCWCRQVGTVLSRSVSQSESLVQA